MKSNTRLAIKSAAISFLFLIGAILSFGLAILTFFYMHPLIGILFALLGTGSLLAVDPHNRGYTQSQYSGYGTSSSGESYSYNNDPSTRCSCGGYLVGGPSMWECSSCGAPRT